MYGMAIPAQPRASTTASKHILQHISPRPVSDSHVEEGRRVEGIYAAESQSARERRARGERPVAISPPGLSHARALSVH